MDTTALERLLAENEELRRRVEALEADKALAEAREAQNASRTAKLERVLRELPLIVDIFDVNTARSVFKNRELNALLGYAPGALEKMGPQPTMYKTVHAEDLPRVLEFLERIRGAQGDMADASVEYRVNRGDSAPGWFRSHLQPFEHNEKGRLTTVLMVTYDITETKLAEAALLALNHELDGLVAERTESLERANQTLRDEVELRTQMAAEVAERARLIRELSSPLLRIWDDVMAMPIIGTLDKERSELIQHALLAAISQNAVRFSILDLTGVGAIDAETTEHIDRLIRAILLLGAEVVICGIGPAVARVMIENGLSLNAVTVKNLREALHYCIRRRGR